MRTVAVRFMAITILLGLVVALAACGGGGGATPGTPEPGGNQAPAISSLTAERTQVLPSTVKDPSIVAVECSASDPDGDALSYEWSTTGGKFSGSGRLVSWVAPEHLGEYEVKVTVEDGKGASATSSITMEVVSNQAPEILEVTADSAQLLPGARSRLTCVARDADGDSITYLWKASGGSVTGQGDTVTWIAPDLGGDYTVTVTVSDGKGGQDSAQTTIAVSATVQTRKFNTVASETGTVDSKGDKNNQYMKAGDSDKNVGYRAFFSFDITELSDAEIEDAQLTFTTGKAYGTPFDQRQGVGLGGLKLYRVRASRGVLPDYDVKGELLTNAIATMYEPPTVVDVTPEVEAALLATKINVYLQVEAAFVYKTNGNNVADYIDWNLVTLTVTYRE